MLNIILNSELLDKSKGTKHVGYDETTHTYTFDYPCTSHHDCTDYVITLRPGFYKFELYGASGGYTSNALSSHIDEKGNCLNTEIIGQFHGNTVCRKVANRGGAGGYISGNIKISKEIIAYATIGGRGIYEAPPSHTQKGGYGGGGDALSYGDTGSGSGGGQTAVMFLSNDLWHRVIVSGGGGGSDNYWDQTQIYTDDDGSGGSGGGFTAPGAWRHGKYDASKSANSTFGFSFGYGESSRYNGSLNKKYGYTTTYGANDRPGAGSGWFGGFASHDGNSGSGGGSSWALTKDAAIPRGPITAYDSSYNPVQTRPYEFIDQNEFLFTDVKSISGIWEGNGKLLITIINSAAAISCVTRHNNFMDSHYFFYLKFLLLNKQQFMKILIH